MNENIISRDLYLINIEIQKLNKKIDELTINVNNSNEIVVSHIKFVEIVFNYIKKPLFFITNKINNIFLLNDK